MHLQASGEGLHQGGLPAQEDTRKLLALGVGALQGRDLGDGRLEAQKKGLGEGRV